MPLAVSDAAEYRSKVEAATYACVHFSAEWCPPCKDLNDVLDGLQGEFPEVVFLAVDAEKLPDLTEEYSVTSTPHVVLLQQGKKWWEVAGAKVPEITTALRNMTAPEADPRVPLDERLRILTSRSPIILFMVGTRDKPFCGFSKGAIALLDSLNIQFDWYNVLNNDAICEGLKKFSNWPTYPQLYVKGQLLGGLDVMKEMNE
eukprot:EG_transcript_31182